MADIDDGDELDSVKEGASNIKNKASEAKEHAKQITDMSKKISKNASKKSRKIFETISKVASKLAPILPWILLIIVILVVIIGLIAFLMTMPGMLTGKLKEFAQNITDKFEAMIDGGAEAYINDDDIIDTANYIKSMGYDLIGFGFIPANEIYTDKYKDTEQLTEEGYTDSDGNGIYKDANGNVYTGNYIGDDGVLYSGATGQKCDDGKASNYTDKFGITYTTDGDEKGAEGTYETSGTIVGFDSSTDTSLIRTYLMSDMKNYIIRNNDKSNIKGAFIMSLINSLSNFGNTQASIVPNQSAPYSAEDILNQYAGKNKWAYGLISLYNAEKGLATNTYDASDKGSIKIDSSNKTMTIKGNSSSNPITYSMDGWTGRYGMPLEFLLSLHLASMAPDLVNTMARTYNTDIQVYLDSIGDGEEEVTMTAFFKTDSGEYITLEAITAKEDDGGAGSGKVISNKDAYKVMKQYGIKSKTYGEFKCENNQETQKIGEEESVTEVLRDGDLLLKVTDFSSWKGLKEQDTFGSGTVLQKSNMGKFIENINKKIEEIKETYSITEEPEIIQELKSLKVDNEDFDSIIEQMLPFEEIRKLYEDDSLTNKEFTIAEFDIKTENNEDAKLILIVDLIKRYDEKNGINFGIKAERTYTASEREEFKNSESPVCSDHFDEEDFNSVCTACEKYVESIKAALSATQKNNFKGKVPYIARVIDSWFRDTYFVIPQEADMAIEKAYSDDVNFGHGEIYGEEVGKIKLTGEDIELINVDDQYLEETGEHWTEYEMNDDGSYKLFELNSDGTIGDEWIKTEEEAEKEGVQLVKKPITKTSAELGSSTKEEYKDSLVWSAYNYSSTTSNNLVPLEVNDEMNNTSIKDVCKNEDGSYSEKIYYSIGSSRTIAQVEDGQRGITNSKIKKMFKIRKYYMYDGTEDRAKAIYEDWQRVLKDYSCDEDTMNGYLDDFYYNDDKTNFTEDPRDEDLIGNIDINTDSLNAFSILENIHTLDADYVYRDFKELIVELNYFNKEDLSDKVPNVFTWILPEFTNKWPVRLIDKSEEYYGTYIHSNDAIENIKEKLGIHKTENDEEETSSEESGLNKNAEMTELELAKGYAYAGASAKSDEDSEENETVTITSLGEVVSPVTGEIVGYGTYERTNTDLVKYEGLSEDEAKETVGYVQIKVMDSEYFDKSWVTGNTNVGKKTEDDSTKYTNAEALNAYYEEYKGVCEGYIVTIDGIKLLDGATDLNSLKSLALDKFKVTDSFKANKTPNIVDDKKENENQQKENAKAEAPAAAKNGDHIYVREGTILGYTTKNEHENEKEKDYSYIRVILRNDKKALRENVENYFKLAQTMTMKGEAYDGGNLNDKYLNWLYQLEGGDYYRDGDYFIAKDIGDGTVTAGPGITNWCNQYFWNLGYEEYVHNEKGGNVGMKNNDRIPYQVIMDVFEAKTEADTKAIQNAFEGIEFSEGEIAALLALKYQAGHIPDSIKDEVIRYKNNDPNNLRTVWENYINTQNSKFKAGISNRRKKECKVFFDDDCT